MDEERLAEWKTETERKIFHLQVYVGILFLAAIVGAWFIYATVKFLVEIEKLFQLFRL